MCGFMVTQVYGHVGVCMRVCAQARVAGGGLFSGLNNGNDCDGGDHSDLTMVAAIMVVMVVVIITNYNSIIIH